MRILFSSQPVIGHVFPLLPLERAAREAGHHTAVMTGAALAASLPPVVELLAVGRPVPETIAEASRRLEARDPSETEPSEVELFAGASVDLGFDDALRAATWFAPDLVICETLDFTGRLVAAALGVPWVLHEISGPMASELVVALTARAARQHGLRSLVPSEPIAVIDPFPELLAGRKPTAVPRRLVMRPSAHDDASSAPGVELPTLDHGRPVVLLTIGTTIDPERNGDPLPGMLTATLAADVEVVVTANPNEIDPGPHADRVHAVGFVPLAELLPRVAAVVTVGGSGTVLASSAAGRPMVVLPVKADQPFNAAQVAALGTGIAVATTEQITDALRRVLTDRTIRDKAAQVARTIAELPSPALVLEQLLVLLAARTGAAVTKSDEPSR